MKTTYFTLSLCLIGMTAQGAVTAIPDLVVTGGYNQSNPLGISISGETGVYLVGTMTIADTTALNGSFNEANLGQGTTFNAGYGNGFGGNTIVIARNGTRGTAPETFASATATVLVIKFDQVTGAANLWVNPNLGTTEALNIPSATATVNEVIGATFDSVIYRGGDFTAPASEISFTGFSVYNGGDSPFAAIPEPSSLALLVLGGLFAGRRRR